MSDHTLETVWTDARGSERHLAIEFSCGYRGHHGFFDPATGDGEGPCGPEIEIAEIEEHVGTEWKPVDNETFNAINADDNIYQKMCAVMDDDDRQGQFGVGA